VALTFSYLLLLLLLLLFFFFPHLILLRFPFCLPLPPPFFGKSVFRVTDAPEIHSNGFHVRFDVIKEPSLGYILPEWRSPDEPQHPDARRWTTTIALPFKDAIRRDTSSLVRQFDDIRPSLLLFTHRLRSIAVRDEIAGTVREMARSSLGDGIVDADGRWLIEREELATDEGVRRGGADLTEIALAFPLDKDSESESDNDNDGDEDGLPPQRPAFAFLPLRNYGLRFIVQADFVLPSSREDIATDSTWNQWLRSRVPRLFASAMSRMRSRFGSPEVGMMARMLDFVPLEGEVHGFFLPAAREIVHAMRATECVAAAPCDGEGEAGAAVVWSKPRHVLTPPRDERLRAIVTPSVLQGCLGLRFVHGSFAVHPRVRKALGVRDFSARHLVEVMRRRAEAMARDGSVDIGWLGDCMAHVEEHLRACDRASALGLVAELRASPIGKWLVVVLSVPFPSLPFLSFFFFFFIFFYFFIFFFLIAITVIIVTTTTRAPHPI
jgi:hypothetical protein